MNQWTTIENEKVTISARLEVPDLTDIPTEYTVATLPGVSDEYWRALFGVNGHFVTVSVTGFDVWPMPRDAGLQTLIEQVGRLKSENAT